MTTQIGATTSVTRRTEVAAPVEHAFRVFTEGIDTWWDPAHHLLDSELADMHFEPRVGGHIVDRYADGRECRWSRVLAYDPPRRVVFSWEGMRNAVDSGWSLEQYAAAARATS